MNHIKQSLIDQCADLLEDKISRLEKLAGDVQDAANNETKSSAGDKYETGRAMMQAEKDKYMQQLAQAIFVQSQLEQIKAYRSFDQVAFGAIVKTKLANYFIGISAGRLEVEGEKYYVISPQAPLAQVLMGKHAGETFSFNNQEIKIETVF
jgi:transcription elongation GreA/GreB family factor